LSRAVFDGADLTGSSFNDADLDGTSFVGANAASCHFDQFVDSGGRPREPGSQYPGEQLLDLATRFAADQAFQYDGPRFDCADLRNATFRNHVLFLFSPDDFWHLGSYTTSFRGTRLDGADFRTVGVLGVGNGPNAITPELFVTGAGGTSNGTKAYSFFAWFDTDNSAFPPAVPSDATRQRFITSTRALADAFAGAQWRRAKLPRPVSTLFSESPPPAASGRPCEATHSH